MKRLRDYGITIGTFEPGPLNAITDVEGVLVGHTTLESNEGGRAIRSGVTAIRPRAGDIFHERLPAGSFILNGAGEMSGLIQVAEWGLIETPILLTNTMSVGSVSAATVAYMLDQFPGIGHEHDVLIPLVGECDDSFLNDVSRPVIEQEHVWAAIDGAAGGRVAEGSVGAGTGMITCDLKAGIGTSSRIVPFEGGDDWRLGVLVLSNVGRLEDLRLDGLPVGRALSPAVSLAERRRSLYGSIIVVIATDAPVSSKQIDRLCKRAALGVGRVGSYAAHGSGEIMTGFSTANTILRVAPGPQTISTVADTTLDPLYAATIECTEEAIWNALCAASPMTGVRGNSAAAAPMEFIADMWRRREDLLRTATATP